MITEETRRKMSLAKKGKSPWNKGKTGVYSEETLRKFSLRRKGKKNSEEHKRKISMSLMGHRPWNKGKVWSQETRMKISIGNKGKRGCLGKKYPKELYPNFGHRGKKVWNSGISVYTNTGRTRFKKGRKNNMHYFKGDKELPKKSRDLSRVIIKKSNCEICNDNFKLQRHHWDYSKHLLVNTLCKTCHEIQHVKDFNQSKFGGQFL